jgi:hypothetical protein
MKLIKSNPRVLILALMVSFVSDIVAAPLGTAFTYQGKLANDGNPANGNYDLRFTIYDSSGGPTVVAGPITNTPTTLSSNGLFTVSLNFGAGAFGGEARWLEIGVRTNSAAVGFTPLSPRQPLTPTPYALYAPSAGLAATATTAATANNFAGNLTGDVTGTQLATVVARVGGQTATLVASGSVTATAATNANTPDRIVKRDASGNFSAGAITAASFTGGGSGLTGLTASQLTSGTVPDGRLAGTYSSALMLNNAGNSFTGNGAGLTNLSAGSLASGTVPSARLSGTYSGAVVFNNAGNVFTGSGAGLTNAGLVRTTVLNVDCSGSGVSYSGTYTKVADIGTFTKLLANSTIEVTFNGRTYVNVVGFGSAGAIFELRMDNTATSNGRARASYKYSEAGNNNFIGVQTSITGVFTGLAATTHTVSMWVQAKEAGGSGVGAQLDPGCWLTDYVVVKEFK